MAQVIEDGILVCDDCVQAIANDDYTCMDDLREALVRAGLSELNERGYAVVKDEQGFHWSSCQCCGALAGNRHEVALLGTR